MVKTKKSARENAPTQPLPERIKQLETRLAKTEELLGNLDEKLAQTLPRVDRASSDANEAKNVATSAANHAEEVSDNVSFLRYNLEKRGVIRRKDYRGYYDRPSEDERPR